MPIPHPCLSAISAQDHPRGTPDFSFDSDPNSGVWVWDSGNGGWFIVGGTSVASSSLAGIVNAAGNDYGSSATELSIIYKNRGNKSDFSDIKSGVCGPSNGYIGMTGWDFRTGVGTPVGYGGK